MPRKPNYKFERMERDRAKAAKKAERLKMKQERAELKKTEDEGGLAPAGQIAGGQIAGGQIAGGQIASGQIAVGQAAAEPAPNEPAPTSQPPNEPARAEE